MAEATADRIYADNLPRPDKHMPALDSLRGVAILSVLIYHGLGTLAPIYRGVLAGAQFDALRLSEWGGLGVQLFFVLSGFLITGILLDTRTNNDYYGKFYERRALRILPAFVLINIVLLALHRTNLHYAMLALFFVANLQMSPPNPMFYTAFWSLAVEEQFYLCWPTVLRLLTPRRSFVFALGIFVLSPLIRLGALHTSHFADVTYKPWGQLDFFCGGACIAMLIRSSRTRPHLWKIFWGLLAVSIVGFIIYRGALSAFGSGSRVAQATFSTPCAMLFTAATLGAFLLPRLASTVVGRGLAFLGYISYGLYLVHPLIQFVVQDRWTIPVTVNRAGIAPLIARFLCFSTISILLAWLSRSTFEAYFLRLKPKQRKVALDVPIVV